jgi:rod shape-determining protein MreD
MSFMLIIVLMFVVNAIQAVLSVYVAPTSLVLDLTLIAVVFYSIKYQEEGGTVIGFFFGLLQDAFSGGVFGMNAFCKTMVGFIVGKTAKKLLLESFVTYFLVIFCANILEGIMAFLLLIIFEVVTVHNFAVNLLPSSFLNGIIGIAVFRLIRLFRRRSIDDDLTLEDYR